MTLKQLSTLLATYKIPLPQLEALNLLALVTKTSQEKILAGDFQLSSSQTTKLKQLAKARRTTPLAYLKQEKEFYGLKFYVDNRVLIPRPESEDLVSLALGLKTKFSTVYDVGAGSGCLAIAYAKHSPNKVKLNFIDVKPGALAVAQKNCASLKAGQSHFINCDIQDVQASLFKNKSLVFANLPYLDLKDRQKFEKNWTGLKSEPSEALYATEGGLKFYRLLFKLLINSQPTIICESLTTQKKRLQEIASLQGFQLLASKGLASVFSKEK